MPAYDPKRPRPGGGDAEEPAPVDALLDPGSAAGVDPADDDLVVTTTVSEELLVDDETGQVVGERTVTDEVVEDATTGEVVAEEIVIEEVTVDDETGDVTVSTTVIDEVSTEDGVVVVSRPSSTRSRSTTRPVTWSCPRRSSRTSSSRSRTPSRSRSTCVRRRPTGPAVGWAPRFRWRLRPRRARPTGPSSSPVSAPPAWSPCSWRSCCAAVAPTESSRRVRRRRSPATRVESRDLS
jgi:hypothetical protein